MEPLIQARKVSFSYASENRPKQVLQDVSFTINRGEMVAIQGPSGSGKSTLFYLLGGMLAGASGSIRILNTELAGLNDSELALFRNRHIGFVFQQFHLLARANVLQNILLPTSYPVETAQVTPADHARARDLTKKLGIHDLAESLPNQLSGGQQQRVAIARALMRDVDLILADEPTGSLDSQSAAQVMDVLKELGRSGKTVVIITHDHEIARQCQRILEFKDGKIQNAETSPQLTENVTPAPSTNPPLWGNNRTKLALRSLPTVFGNIWRNKLKSMLTMVGISIGTASVLSMLSLGEFTKRRMLEGYESLGVNKIRLTGYRNWRLSADELRKSPAIFQSFQMATDVKSITEIFPEIAQISPFIVSWGSKASYGGKQVTEDIFLEGTNPSYFTITSGKLRSGEFFDQHHVDRRDRVCVVGPDVPKMLQIRPDDAPGIFINITARDGKGAFPCKMIGVLESQRSEEQWYKPNLRVVMPYTTVQTTGNIWDSQIRSLAIGLARGADVAATGAKIVNYFEGVYGKSGEFNVDQNSKLVSEMKRFLTLFTWLLASVAFLTLAVGGVGIHNMMLVAVSDRLKEIGLRKALGATAASIRVLFLAEAITLCGTAGLIGMVAGYGVCQGAIYMASKLMKGVEYEWVFNPWAFAISGIAIVTVGILSGLMPALKAESLTVIDALRSE